jgi:hypothetical protein
VEKVAQLFAKLRTFSQKLPKVNSRPTGENSPDLVTLLSAVHKRRREQ